MVDYYALISPTIEPLANASPDERKVVYERLVKMLDQQLRAAEPPRSDKDILKERINLEAAIRRVERGIINSRKQNTPAQPKAAATFTEPLEKPAPAPLEPARVPDRLEQAEPAHTDVASPVEPATIPADDPATSDQTLAPSPAIVAQNSVRLPSAPPPGVFVSSPSGEAVEPEPDLSETVLPDDRLPDTLPLTNRPSYPLPAEGVDSDATHKALPDDEVSLNPPTDRFPDQEQAVAEKSVDLRPGLPSQGGIRPLGARLTQHAKGLWLRIGILALVILALASAIGGIAEYLSQRSAERIANRGQTPVADVTTAEQKILDRLPLVVDESTKATDAQSGAPSANGMAQASDNGEQEVLIQRAILLEEPPGGLGDPKRTMGRVTWKLETLRSTLSNTSDIGARATIDLPDAGLSASLVFRRNRDPSSANAHLIEITMTPSPDNPNGKIRDISVPELRVDEKARGTTLAGIAVPVADNVFLIGLNALPSDMKHNIDLLRDRSWFLVPMRYANGKRALLLFEKGKPGERVFEDAMQTWQ